MLASLALPFVPTPYGDIPAVHCTRLFPRFSRSVCRNLLAPSVLMFLPFGKSQFTPTSAHAPGIYSLTQPKPDSPTPLTSAYTAPTSQALPSVRGPSSPSPQAPPPLSRPRSPAWWPLRPPACPSGGRGCRR